MALLGFFVGGTIVAFTIERPSGLAGAGTAAFSALLGAAIGLGFAIYVFRNSSTKQVMRINIVSTVIIFVLIAALQWKKANSAVLVTTSAHLPEYYQIDDQTIRSLGLAKPNFYEYPVLYFYNPNLDKAVDEHMPMDSVVFKRTEREFEISYAPAWYYPQHMKLDYDVLLHKVITVGRDWIELEVNQSTQQTAWVDASRVDISFWPQFLLSINSVKPLETMNPVRIKALDHASEVAVDYSMLTPIMVKGEWIKVALVNDNYERIAEGWIRWAKDGKWQISYSLFS